MLVPFRPEAMPLYRVVILVNLALAVGTLAGYLWRQGEIDALRSDLNRARLARLTPAVTPRQWSASGIVRGPLSDRGALLITHEPMGPMRAMTMAFPVAAIGCSASPVRASAFGSPWSSATATSWWWPSSARRARGSPAAAPDREGMTPRGRA
jgi:hypothetical protein